MGASNTPLPDLIELSSLNSNATFTVTPGGGGDIEGVVDNATYSDSDSANSNSHISELNDSYASDSGTLIIDGKAYITQLVSPADDTQAVTVTYNGGASSVDLTGDCYMSEVAFIIASPLGGGSDRYFTVFDDSIGDLPDITSIQIRDLDWNPFGHDIIMDVSGDNNVAPVCFLQGTMIRTPLGETRVENLKPGDLVATVDHGPLPIRWIGRREMVFTAENAHHRPIQIKAGSLGPGYPTTDLAVSPQHRILLDGPEVLFAHGAAEILAVAKGLTEMRHIRQMKGKSEARYYALMLDQHALIWANGARAESFYPGQTALKLLSPQHRNAIERLFPKLTEDAQKSYGPYARPVLNCQDTRNLVRVLSQQIPIHPAAE